MQAESEVPVIWSDIDLPALTTALTDYCSEILNSTTAFEIEQAFFPVRGILHAISPVIDVEAVATKSPKTDFCEMIEQVNADLRGAKANKEFSQEHPAYKKLVTICDALNQMCGIETEIASVFSVAEALEVDGIKEEFRIIVFEALSSNGELAWLKFICNFLVKVINNELLLGKDLAETKRVIDSMIKSVLRFAVDQDVEKHDAFFTQLNAIFAWNEAINQVIKELENSQAYAYNLSLAAKISAQKQAYLNSMSRDILAATMGVAAALQSGHQKLEDLNQALIDAEEANKPSALDVLYSEDISARPEDCLAADRAVLKLTRHANELQAEAYFIQANPDQKETIQNLARATEKLKLNLEQRLAEADLKTEPLTESPVYAQLQHTDDLLKAIRNEDKTLEQKQRYLQAYKEIYGLKYSRLEKVTGIFISAVAGFIVGTLAGAALGGGAGGLTGAFALGVGAVPGSLCGAAVGACVGGLGGAAAGGVAAYKYFNHKRAEQKLALTFVSAAAQIDVPPPQFSTTSPGRDPGACSAERLQQEVFIPKSEGSAEPSFGD